jgi:hypothetical protein
VVSEGAEVVLAYSRGDGSDPLAFLAAPRGFPGHVPTTVYHEATTDIRFVWASDGSVYVGSEPVPVATAPLLQLYLQKLEAWALKVDVAAEAIAAVLGIPAPNSTADIVAAAEARIAAAGYTPPAEAASFSAIVSTRLFAQTDRNEPLPGPM